MKSWKALAFLCFGVVLGYYAHAQTNGQTTPNFGWWDTTAHLIAGPGVSPAGGYAFTGDQGPVWSNGTSWSQIYGRLAAVSASVGSSILLLGGCTAAQTVTVTGAAIGMPVLVSPNVAQPNGTFAYGAVSSANTVTFYVCAPVIGVTTAASTWNVKVFTS